MSILVIPQLLIPLNYESYIIYNDNMLKRTNLYCKIKGNVMLNIKESITEDYEERYCVHLAGEDKEIIVNHHNLDKKEFNDEISKIIKKLFDDYADIKG